MCSMRSITRKQLEIVFIEFTTNVSVLVYILRIIKISGRRIRDHMVVGFTTTYGISAYHH